MSLDNLKAKADAVKEALGEFYDALHEEVSSVVTRLENSLEVAPPIASVESPVVPATDSTNFNSIGVKDLVADSPASTSDTNTENEGPQTGPENSIDTETDNSHA